MPTYEDRDASDAVGESDCVLLILGALLSCPPLAPDMAVSGRL
jgi:hypothetical protein